MIRPEFLDNDSSVVIKGMKMPESCDCCIFNRNNGPYPGVSCMFSTHAWPDRPRTDEEPRLDFCPLVPVPPHGRLIDADALAGLFRAKVAGEKGLGPLIVNLAALCIDNAPTIIPAEPLKKDTYE